MQLQAWADNAVDAADQHHQAGFEVAVQRNLVHTVQRNVHEAGDAPFYHHGAAHQVTHQAAHGGEV